MENGIIPIRYYLNYYIGGQDGQENFGGKWNQLPILFFMSVPWSNLIIYDTHFKYIKTFQYMNYNIDDDRMEGVLVANLPSNGGILSN